MLRWHKEMIAILVTDNDFPGMSCHTVTGSVLIVDDSQ